MTIADKSEKVTLSPPLLAALHGWIILDKAEGPGSTQAVSAVKRAIRLAGLPKVKVGHGGTLDPLASGVLPVALGEATKLAGYALNSDKVYEFTLRFGEETDSLDREGAVIAQSDNRPTKEAIESILPSFQGNIHQIPPIYSALKIDGKRACDRVRAGETVTVKGRDITIYDLNLVAYSPDEASFRATVSKGTYIRSLARDIAHALDCHGHVSRLRRCKSGPFTDKQAISLDKLMEIANTGKLNKILLPLTAGLDDIPAFAVSSDQAKALRQGQKLVGINAEQGLNMAMETEMPVALIEVFEQQARVLRGFNF
ncbi:tRNA pseudouridine(55) synthase TruB [Zymomonas mobilis]|uniref:tRNA pseudouridine synthase B n=1 Tax=Zymomonas mobilis subsp. pomaceae (strain ATCC 29192 / DSM 22645 / JCM 10191 / CCUG 17912 / NBRC 13757 / NCIMB 11200 / NRRL B-4491 / Barker I) TaxID=579138 RepID=F8ERZ1_ZYMMT|nr:tRNA pseudouridine(55) synthase TruB [Zymomonas mobilis]AEI37566.1 tRNA pseudouridine synthase B [Zymomonas mobilis subsp. pomaceae ATCC 29192]MDX5948934.1 tRNA pseudouridine(55) synthase TruB [Zymomonas mobilis subsp. pomaceae]GEB88739.1 tRNA pseudouridine synthase B [Zymomonas mobilis subsp. pomaceae]